MTDPTQYMQKHETFANFRWKKRWSKSNGPVAALDRSSRTGMVHIVNAMGVVYADPEDLPAIRDQLKAAVDLIEQEIERLG
jgi:hypothetical protein